MRDSYGINKYTPNDHAQPHSGETLACSFCGQTAVYHLAMEDMWKGCAMPGGVGYVCNKDVCKRTAEKRGVPL